jgi:hypothetical protein
MVAQFSIRTLVLGYAAGTVARLAYRRRVRDAASASK